MGVILHMEPCGALERWLGGRVRDELLVSGLRIGSFPGDKAFEASTDVLIVLLLGLIRDEAEDI